MKQIQLALQFTLLEILCLTVLGVDNFTVQFMGSCTSSIDLKVAYSGTGTVDIISWKFSKMADPAKTLNMIAALCQAGAGADPAFPVSRMNFTCDDTENIYTATISNFNESTDAGDWEAALSIGGSYTNFKSVSIECETPGPDCVCDCECKCEILVINCAVFDGLGIIGLICDIVATLKKLLKSKVGLVLFGIAVFVLFIISIGLGAAALGNDDCDPDCCCPDEDCCCSDWVGNGATAFVVISSLGAVCAAFISFLICVNAIGPGKKEEGGPDGPDGGHNGGGALMTHARVHAGHEETHRGSLSNRADSDSAVSRQDVHVQENQGHLSGRPMPAIPTHQGQDKKGRGLSANFDDDHPMVSISVPEKKAGDLGPLHEEPQKKKKKKKKRTDEE